VLGWETWQSSRVSWGWSRNARLMDPGADYRIVVQGGYWCLRENDCCEAENIERDT
jgi:hypothetical protein